MSKIVFLVEPDFFCKHIGVRNYFFSLMCLLEKEHRVDIVAYYRDAFGDLYYYRVHFKGREFVFNNGNLDSWKIEGKPSDILKTYYDGNPNASANGEQLYYSHIGTEIAKEEYDVCFFTNPWLINFSERFPAKKLYGIIYDLVPNCYALTRNNPPFEFAASHSRGFAYYIKHCDHIFAISQDAKDQFMRFFAVDHNKVTALDALIPNGYFDYTPSLKPSEKNLALAGPFDLRKGLKELPSLINPVADQIDNLMIYGDIRCMPSDAMEFFDNIEVKNIVWYPKATTADVQKLFEQSKLLLFPSLEEGLGLPIIESQICGTPVIVRNKAPMNQLALQGSFVMENERETTIAALERMLNDDFDRKSLSEEAQDIFNPSNVLNRIKMVDCCL